MVDTTATTRLKRVLRKEVAYLCRRVERGWNAPIVETLDGVRQMGSRAVFFGGTLRSLLASRLFRRRPGRPRDVDIVVEGVTVDRLREHFRGALARETRFGGLSLENRQWRFDVWPLNKTWAFAQQTGIKPSFATLPDTTFLNLEAIAVDIWPPPNGKRRIYSSRDQFFEGILSSTLELNYQDNPFPALCVVRSLVIAANLDFAIGPKLANYIAQHGDTISGDELESVQHQHYGLKRYDGKVLRHWIEHISECHERDDQESARLPTARQLTLWPDDAVTFSGRMRLFVTI